MENPKKKPSFKPYPRLKGTRTVDKERIRDIYLADDEPDFRDFCEGKGWNWSVLKNLVPFAKWRLEWIEKKVGEQNLATVPKAMAIREFVLRKRIDSIDEDVKMADAMANIHRGLVHIYGKMLNRDIELLNKDPSIINKMVHYETRESQKHGKVIVQRAYRPSIPVQEWRMLNEGYLKIQEIRHRALFVSQSKDQIDERMKQIKEQAILSAEQANQLGVEDEAIGIKGLGMIKPADLEQAICKWFDKKVMDPNELQSPQAPPSGEAPAQLPDDEPIE